MHDVLNVFMCTGFTRDTGQYFMKASPVRPGDYLEFMAEIDLLGALSACPGGDCSAEHSSDVAACHPLLVQVFRPMATARWVGQPPGPEPLRPEPRSGITFDRRGLLVVVAVAPGPAGGKEAVDLLTVVVGEVDLGRHRPRRCR